MFSKRASRLLLATATLVTAAAAVSAVGVTTSGATTSATSALPRLNAPGLHVQVAPTAAPTTGNACGYIPAIPADSFKGIPVFNAAQAAKPYSVRFYTTQGVITVKMLTGAAPCTTFSFLAADGYRVALLARRLDRITTLADELGHGSIALEADVTDRDRIVAAADRVRQELGTADALINNAGVMLLGPLDSGQRADYRQMIEVNLAINEILLRPAGQQ
jgi:short subunit dehydrogenase